jgi:hypothetical protein
MLKKLRTYLGRVIRDIGRKIEGDGGLEAAFAPLLLLGPRSIPCTRRKSNASAKARPIGPTSSASRSPSLPPSATPRAAGSSPMLAFSLRSQTEFTISEILFAKGSSASCDKAECVIDRRQDAPIHKVQSRGFE